MYWIGEKFSHPSEIVGSQKHRLAGFRKSIVPTKTIFHFGLHTHGACSLEYPFNGCTGKTPGICTDTADKDKSKYYVKANDETSYRKTHRFIDGVTLNEVKDIDMEKEAALFHCQVFRNHKLLHPSINITETNEYAEFYYPQVAIALRRRQLDLLIDIPSTKLRVISPHRQWSTFATIYYSRKKYGTLIP